MIPKLVVTEAFALHLSDRAATTNHSMPTLKLLVPLGSQLQLSVADRAQRTTQAMLSKPGLRHAVACDGPVLALMIPTQHAAALARRSAEPLELLSTRETAALAAATAAGLDRLDDPGAAADLVAELLARLAPAPAHLDPRVVRTLARLDRLDGPTPPLDALAAEVELSPSRLAHLFAAQVGAPIRRYALWRRLSLAAAALGQGQSQAAAALGAGFADQAHLCRTARALVGRPASAIATA